MPRAGSARRRPAGANGLLVGGLARGSPRSSRRRRGSGFGGSPRPWLARSFALGSRRGLSLVSQTSGSVIGVWLVGSVLGVPALDEAFLGFVCLALPRA